MSVHDFVLINIFALVLTLLIGFLVGENNEDAAAPFVFLLWISGCIWAFYFIFVFLVAETR